MSIADLYNRIRYYLKYNKDTRHICIPCKDWQYDDRGRPIGKNGKPRWMNGETSQLVPAVVYDYLEKNYNYFLQLIHEHSHGETVAENFDNNSPIYVFVWYNNKTTRTLIESLNRQLARIKIPMEVDGETYQIELEIEIRPEAHLC